MTVTVSALTMAGGTTRIAAARTPLEKWFLTRGKTPFQFQRDVWDAYLAGESGLIHAATGTGKTLAAWGGPLLEWMLERSRNATASQPTARNGPRPRRDPAPAPALRVLWITPLRALAADTVEALREPLQALNLPWTLETRTSDTGVPFARGNAGGFRRFSLRHLRASPCFSPGRMLARGSPASV